jgi:hypothetical protein
LMGFWRKQIIMSILAECQPFLRHGLGETRAKPMASGPQAMDWVRTRYHIHVVWIWWYNQKPRYYVKHPY